MLRFLVRAVLVFILAMILAPGIVLVDFKLDQERIARELCVQRDVVEQMRTCHGHCQLSKRFKQLEHEAEAGVPVELLEHRLEPLTPVHTTEQVVAQACALRHFPRYSDALIHRSLDRVDHVPRG